MNVRRFFFYAIPFGAAVLLGGQLAQAVDFEFSGEMRPRTEMATNGVVGSKVGEHISFTTMRTRLGVKANVDKNVSGFIQLQDLRTFGGEIPSKAPPSIGQSATSVDSNGLAIYQGYMDLKNVLGSGVDLKIGRQEFSFDEVRLFGNFNWGQQGQSEDAIRSDVDLGQFIDGLSMTAFYGKTIALKTHPTISGTLFGQTAFESSFAGGRLTYKLGDKGDRITPYIYYFLNPSRTGALVGTTNVQSAPNIAKNIEYSGAYFLKHFKIMDQGFRFRFDGAYESGNVNTTTDIKAYMLTAALGTNLDIMHGANITFWYDYMSGDTNINDGTDHTFILPLDTFHKFFGLIDKFLNVPTAGIQDIALKMSLKPTAKLKLSLHFHQFLSARTSTATAPPKNLGQEIDLFAKFPIAKNTMLVFGYDHYFGNGTVSAAAPGGIHSVAIADTTVDANFGYALVDLKF